MTGMSKDSKPPGSSGVEVSIDTMTQAAATRKPARGSLALRNAFIAGEERGRAAFISYFLAGYPSPEDTVDVLLAMERGGTDIIELGVPFSNPTADGPTIQKAHAAVMSGAKPTTLGDTIDLAKEARVRGLKVPIVLMGYYNPFLAFGARKLMAACVESGVDGFIIVDLPPEEGEEFFGLCDEFGLSFVPLLTPESSTKRITLLTAHASSFVYCVSQVGVTGARQAVPPGLEAYLDRVRNLTSAPLAVGFGISTPGHVDTVGSLAEGVVVGSEVIKAAHPVPAGQTAAGAVEAAVRVLTTAPAEPLPRKTLRRVGRLLRVAVRQHAQMVYWSEYSTGGGGRATRGGDGGGRFQATVKQAGDAAEADAVRTYSDAEASFGAFGGIYVPELLVAPLMALWTAYKAARVDPAFMALLAQEQRDVASRVTPLFFCARLSRACGGARIFLKREDRAGQGSHHINNALGQALLASRLGLRRVITTCGSGGHGVAAATACRRQALECIVYMPSTNTVRHGEAVQLMRSLGAQVVPVEGTLSAAIDECLRDLVAHVGTTYYMAASATGPHPMPTIVRDFQAVIGIEARQQCLDQIGQLPRTVVASVGGGGEAIGMFSAFLADADVELVGVEGGGDGESTAATLSRGTPGVLHGARTYLLQERGTGQICDERSLAADLEYPGANPELAMLKDAGRVRFVEVRAHMKEKGVGGGRGRPRERERERASTHNTHTHTRTHTSHARAYVCLARAGERRQRVRGLPGARRA